LVIVESKEKPGKRRGIQSVGVGLRVLSALASQKGAANLSSIAQVAALSASQTHRYLSSLMEAGMVKQEQRSGLYDLDAGAIRLGLAALSRIDIFTMADEVFAKFAKDSGRTCLVAIWGDAGATIVRWFDGVPPVITSLAIGSVLPPLRSATGRVFCAFGEPAQIERIGKSILRSEKKAVAGANAILANVKTTGFATVRGDLIPGLRAVAAPVFDLQGRLVLVASALAYEGMLASDDTETAGQLLAACKQLTEALGGNWPLR
tara:strand:- start:1493 stop:2278 length:786 start_codon:yes stop_codon:yes gene_type:complete